MRPLDSTHSTVRPAPAAVPAKTARTRYRRITERKMERMTHKTRSAAARLSNHTQIRASQKAWRSLHDTRRPLRPTGTNPDVRTRGSRSPLCASAECSSVFCGVRGGAEAALHLQRHTPEGHGPPEARPGSVLTGMRICWRNDWHRHLSHGAPLVIVSRWVTPHVIVLALSTPALVTSSQHVLG